MEQQNQPTEGTFLRSSRCQCSPRCHLSQPPLPLHKYQDDQTISLDKLRSAYLGQIQEFSTFLPVFDKFIDDIRQRVGHTISKESLQKYSVLRKHFFEFLVHRYKRKDIGLMEFTPAIIQDFELYLTTVALCVESDQERAFLLPTQAGRLPQRPSSRAKDRQRLPHRLVPILLGNKSIQKVFSGYELHDDFDGSPEYELLYTELTGTIVLHTNFRRSRLNTSPPHSPRKSSVLHANSRHTSLSIFSLLSSLLVEGISEAPF